MADAVVLDNRVVTSEPARACLVTCHASPAWTRYQRAGLFVAVAGGVVMLAGAGAAHDSASIALVVIGGAWLLMGLWGTRQYMGTVSRMSFDGVSVRFNSRTGGERVVPLADIREFRWPRYDFNRFGPMRAVTGDGTYLIAPRCRGLIDFFVALKAANPAIKLPD
jgi:hypothetical protein